MEETGDEDDTRSHDGKTSDGKRKAGDKGVFYGLFSGRKAS